MADPTADLSPNPPERIEDAAFEWAARTPDAPALSEPGRRWTYGELAAAVRESAERLGAAGLGPGDRVMIVNENGLSAAALIFATTSLDAWPVVVNARQSAREIDAIRDHASPRRILYTTDVSDEARAHGDRHGAETLDLGAAGRVAMGPAANGEPEAVPAEPGAGVAAVLYTTGTLGAPKGVLLSHRNVLFVAASPGSQRPAVPGDRIYGVLPITHVFGFASTFMRGLYGGAEIVLAPRFLPDDVLDRLAAGEITILQGVPAMYARLLEHAETAGSAISAPGLRLALAGGAPLDAGLKARVEVALGQPLLNGYGATECAGTVARSLPSQGIGGDHAGLPLAGVDLRFVDEAGRDVAPGEVGEVWVRGPNVMMGYYRDPAATGEVLTPEGWYRSGDLGHLGEDGNLRILDRRREVIIRSGFNVFPTEIEGVLADHPDVTLAAVVGRSAGANEEVVAFVQAVPGRPVTAAALRRYASERLAPYKRPSHIVILESLPAAATGKVLKGELKRRAAELPPAG